MPEIAHPTTGGPPARRGLFIATALVLGVLLACAAAELVVRVSGKQPWRTVHARQNEPVMHEADPGLGWRPMPGRHIVAPYVADGPSVHFTFQPDGTRSTGATPKSRDRLAFIGGSSTEGWAVSDEETFAWRVQQQLPELGVYNYGVTAYGTFQALLVLERILAEPDPPRIVFYALDEEHEPRNVADVKWLLPLALLSKGGIIKVPYATLDGNGGLVRHEPEGYPHWPLREYSALITYLQDIYAYAIGSTRATQARAVTDRLVLEMDRLVKQHGGHFCVIVFHLSPDARAHYLELFTQHGIDYVDCSFPITDEYRVRGDHHANGAMHARYADTIIAKMRTAGWIGP